ncbi:aminopeptidase P family protein [Crossiella cryophila]|uniref:Xaa-Pro aminopeptidase n=1 Tax=Crossiella cryophila TaxID=43355 RepID=A0A7W7FWS7_9PSEU|nr:aminopeptidase P family protein [Crossiella cryophila]MBB4678234.1 Xaa-Pro aminopeptidase [Crossiella cryophila]
MTELVVPTYSPAERDRRWNLAREFMDREGLDALIVFGEHEDNGPAPYYLDTWFTNDRPGQTIVFPRDGEPIALTPVPSFVFDHLEGVRRGDALWIAAGNVRVGRGAATVAEVLQEHGLAKAAIGVAGLEPYIPAHPEGIIPFTLWDAIVARFPEARFTAAGFGLARLMMDLSAEEVAVVRHSAAIGDAMAQAMVETARPGIRENEVYAAGMSAAYLRGTAVPQMHFYSGPEPVVWGPPQWAYRPQAPRVLREGDVITAEIFGQFGMRATQHQVAIAVGEPHPDVERAARVAQDCYRAGLETLRAKRKFGEVAEAMLAPLAEAGGWVKGPQIHGLNPIAALCRVPIDFSQVEGIERYPAVPGIPTLLADLELTPGMSFAFEPSCGFGRRLITLGGTVLVGADEAIELNPYTARLLRAA